MDDNIKIQITYRNKTYAFDFGSEAYIFHIGIYNEIDRKYGLKTLLEYVGVVQHCYLSDSNRTPLGALADYIAAHWKKLKSANRYDILERFYETED